MGVAWPDPRFSEQDQTITDRLTGLIWPRDAGTPAIGACDAGERTWQAALDYVACLNNENYLGHNNWRLPNVHELESLIIHAGQIDMAAWLADQGFNAVMADYYWTSTTLAGGPGSGFYVGMDNARVDYDSKINTYFVLPVRGGRGGEIGLPRTGQTKCFNQDGDEISCAGTGQDGELRKGVAWPDPRFSDDGETLTDMLTGLVWTKDGNAPGPVACGPGGAKTWQAALDYVACLRAEEYLGYDDWRLPNRKELGSLINYDWEKQADGLNALGFSAVQPGWYWSSTTQAHFPAGAWFVGMNYAYIGPGGKNSNSYVWPVRGGQ